jgi:hypothetical protein
MSRSRRQSVGATTVSAAFIAAMSVLAPPAAYAAPARLGTVVTVPLTQVAAITTNAKYKSVGPYLDSGWLELAQAGAARNELYPLTGISLGTRVTIDALGTGGCDPGDHGASNKGKVVCVLPPTDVADHISVFPPKWWLESAIATVAAPEINPAGQIGVAPHTQFDSGFVAIDYEVANGGPKVVVYKYASRTLTFVRRVDGSPVGLRGGRVFVRRPAAIDSVIAVDLASGVESAPYSCPLVSCQVIDTNGTVTVYAKGGNFFLVRNATGEVIFKRAHKLNLSLRGGVVAYKGTSDLVTAPAAISGSHLLWSDGATGGLPDLLEVPIPSTGIVTATPTVVAAHLGVLLDADSTRVVFTPEAAVPVYAVPTLKIAELLR